ncbi:leukocyte immunoglobulin-like receptor subfamily B member 1 [Numida meleagris]|uniref:leukocyte immunoglobulin-like receptor subfamily B member 1 n=1 Tax=Numida meleagris TaxID=8996 RepID=UPI000B3E147F|nr:leukocyte immunoglobulin-like receptor subfamily B member 1 [Numida meleagris]
MAPMVLALILGWWLVAACRAHLLPQPSLSLHLSQEIQEGNNVPLRCDLPQLAAEAEFYQDEQLRLHRHKDKGLDTSEFSFTITKMEHAVKYRCQYQVLEPPGLLEQSDPVELVVTGEGTGDTTWS